jgi:hypothetical protein
MGIHHLQDGQQLLTTVQDVIGFMDGVSLSTDCTDEHVTWNLFYSCYECDTIINNVFAYSSTGICSTVLEIFLVAGQMDP